MKATIMLPALTLWMIRECKIAGSHKEFSERISQRLHHHLIRKAGILIPVFLFLSALKAQELKLTYQVIRNGDVIGKMCFRVSLKAVSNRSQVPLAYPFPMRAFIRSLCSWKIASSILPRWSLPEMKSIRAVLVTCIPDSSSLRLAS